MGEFHNVCMSLVLWWQSEVLPGRAFFSGSADRSVLQGCAYCYTCCVARAWVPARRAQQEKHGGRKIPSITVLRASAARSRLMAPPSHARCRRALLRDFSLRACAPLPLVRAVWSRLAHLHFRRLPYALGASASGVVQTGTHYLHCY